jgi:hypothetical protein
MKLLTYFSVNFTNQLTDFWGNLYITLRSLVTNCFGYQYVHLSLSTEDVSQLSEHSVDL